MQNPRRPGSRKPLNRHRTAPTIQGARLRPVEVDRQRPKAARSLRWTRAGAQPLTVFKSMSGAMKPKMTSQMAPAQFIAQVRDHAGFWSTTGGQRDEIWGRHARSKWFDNVDWMSFAAVGHLETAEFIAEKCGTDTVETVSRTRSSSGRSSRTRSSSGRSSRTRSYASRDLIMPQE